MINECHNMDCSAFMALKKYPADLIVMDPPYNYGQEYAGYNDRDPAFQSNLRKWLRDCTNYLKPNGSLWVFIPDEWVSFVDLSVRTEMMMTRRSWIVWYYTFGVNCKNNFTRSHTHILYFTKSAKNFTFNMDAVPSKRQLIGDKRASPGGRHPDNTWILDPSKLDIPKEHDLWLHSRICGTFNERQPHSPNQLPESILERIVRVATTEGAMVYDPFLGTGTTGVVCKRLGRNFVGTDVSSICVDRSQQRINRS